MQHEVLNCDFSPVNVVVRKFYLPRHRGGTEHNECSDALKSVTNSKDVVQNPFIMKPD